VILLKHFSNFLADRRLQLVVGQIEREQTLVLFEGAQHLLDAGEVLAVTGQGVALQIQELQRLVNTQGFTEFFCSLDLQDVTLEFKLSERCVCVEDSGDVDSVFVLDLAPAKVQSSQGLVGSDVTHKDTDSRTAQLDAGTRVLAWCLVG